MLVLFQIVSGAICLLHSMSGRTVRVVFTPFKVTGAVELELLFKWQGIELPPQSELVVDLFLTDVEVLHIEESCFQILISTKPEDQAQLKCSGAQCIDSPTFLTAWSSCLTSSSFPPGCSYWPRSSVMSSAQSTNARGVVSKMKAARNQESPTVFFGHRDLVIFFNVFAWHLEQCISLREGMAEYLQRLQVARYHNNTLRRPSRIYKSIRT